MSTISPLHHSLLTQLRHLKSQTWSQELNVEGLQSLLQAEPNAIHRSHPSHVTVSVMVFSLDWSQTLLCFHPKAGRWVQPGGHVEPQDQSPWETATRELGEETGLKSPSWFSPHPLDLNHYYGETTFGSCLEHWDLTYGALAATSISLRQEPNSAVGWFPLTSLPTPYPPGLDQQLLRVCTRAQGLR